METTADRVAQWLADEQAARPTWREDHRHACEVRHVAGLDHDTRTDYLATVHKRRGWEAAALLRGDVVAELNRRARERRRAAVLPAARADKADLFDAAAPEASV